MADDRPTEPGAGTVGRHDTGRAGSRLQEYLAVYLKGAAMGTADTLPGVSGGTIALITGIYERLITALTALHPRVLRHVPRLHRAAHRSDFFDELRRMDVPFLVALGLGAMTVLVVLSRIVHGALEQYEAETAAFFFGLIAASAVVMYRQVAVETARQGVAAVAGFGLAFVLAGASQGGGATTGTPLPVVFAIAAIAVSATVLPGVSGAFVLYLAGQYEYLTGVLTTFVDHVIALPAQGVTPAIVDAGTVVGTFGTGAAIGVFSIAYVIRWALDRARAATLAFLVSLMVGSLRLPVSTTAETIDTWTLSAAAGVAAAALVGGAAVYLLDRYTSDLDYAAT